ncbi:MAG TPA: ABC transporter substrate-binding protein [Euzebyales bacterium]|nr:ABC transporter substrate-binding protein [Euzebyales bacterium]
MTEPTRVLLLLLVLLLAVAACTSSAEDDATVRPPQQQEDPDSSAGESEAVSTLEGGTVVIAVPEEPTTLNPWMAEAGGSTATVAGPMLAPLWRVAPDGTSQPWLLAGQPSEQGGGDGEPFTVSFRIRRDAVWSDGTPIDGADVLFTLDLCRRATTREDCADVDLARSEADGKVATVAFERPTAGWRSIMATLPVLPEHAFRGRDPATTWTRRVSVSSGPFRFESWTPGERLVLVRNERWWGERAALDRIEFRFVDDVAVATVGGGDVDVAQVPVAPATLEHARADPRVRAGVAAGPRWLALDFNLADPVLARREVRRALAAAVDRATIVAELVTPVMSTAEVLDGLPGGPLVADDQRLDFPAYDPTVAARELDAAGCPAADDGVRVCPEQRMELTLVTGGDGWQQRILAEYVRSQLAEIGVVVRLADPGADGGTEQASEPAGEAAASWDLRVAAVDIAADPAIGAARWRCDDPANTQSFCDPGYDGIAQRLRESVDGQTRAQLNAQAALLLSRELPTYPMYEMPDLLIHAETVRGPSLNAVSWGPTWNVEEWARTTN